MNECHKLICCSRWFLLLFLFFIIVPIGKSVGRLFGRWMVIQKLFPNLSEKHIQRMVQILFIDRLFGLQNINFRNIFALLSHFKFQNKIKLFFDKILIQIYSYSKRNSYIYHFVFCVCDILLQQVVFFARLYFTGIFFNYVLNSQLLNPSSSSSAVDRAYI